MVADLHLHTSFSDGTYSPEELAGHASAQSLAAVALTDHDSVEGCPRMAAACAAVGIEFIPGAELTAELEGKEFHVLGYWMDIQSPTLLERLAVFQAARRQRILEMVDRLNRRGVALRAEHVFELSNCSAPGRPHVARALVAAGCCSSYDDAFDRYLKKGRPGWVPKVAMPVAESATVSRLGLVTWTPLSLPISPGTKVWMARASTPRTARVKAIMLLLTPRSERRSQDIGFRVCPRAPCPNLC